ncbi:hypothetical protein [Mesorhizobium sp. M0809]|uniref:hypothetical protein n=1 Tax=Mesorhizobium sp. M0809 TaxID=2957003 RepID=UPI0033399011
MSELEAAIPRVAHWGLASLPEVLTGAEIDELAEFLLSGVPVAPDEATQRDSRDRGQLSRRLAHADPLCRRQVTKEAGGIDARNDDPH